ncbi:MAG: ABC transporter permease [Armatimonadota bacterium]|nr:ABC transporter permease [Armatimonadota bacterium]MDR7443723.1 ABC transporter permease [Armatimonadota bacterium]MDR7569920.1 ABC transporter permease [Armatimonadota bacterium]MDR7613749.1 ABC transporter permease [Armatimonadota bacterium]
MSRPVTAVPRPLPRPEAPPAGRSYGQLAFRRLRRHRLAQVSGGVILLLVVASALAPYLTPYRFDEIDLTNRLSPPSWRHPLGTDELGHDVLTRLLYAGRVSLTVGLSAAIASALAGTAVGLVSGFYGGWVDQVLMRVVDVLLSIPDLPILIVLSRYFGGSLWGIILVLVAFGWMGTARLVRGEVLRLRNLEFVEAARALGASSARIMWRHLVPNALGPVIVSATLSVGGAILTEAALSFLGIGIQPPTPSWGNMLQNAQDFIWRTPLLALWPGLMIFVTVLCFNFFGDGLRDALDPRMRP